MFKVRYTAPARTDLLEIAEYLEREAGPKIAQSVIRRIRAQILKLEHDAPRHRERMELGAGRRAILINPYIAFYRIDGDTVFVLRILHGARNITKEFVDD